MKIRELREMSGRYSDGKEKLICVFQNADDIAKELKRCEKESRPLKRVDKSQRLEIANKLGSVFRDLK